MIELQSQDALRAAHARLTRIADKLTDFPALHRRAGEAVVDWAERNFAAEGALLDDFPSGWPALSPATLASRRRRGRGSQILYDSGRLARGTSVIPGPDRAVVDNVVPYAAIHQEGRGVPRRPVLPEAPQAERLVRDAAEEHVQEALR